MPEDFISPAPKGTYEAVESASLNNHDNHKMRFKAGTTTVEVTALADGIFRIGAFPNGRTPRYDTPAISYETFDAPNVSMQETDDGYAYDGYTLQFGGASVHIATNPLRVSFTDADANALCADDEERRLRTKTAHTQGAP